MKKPQHQVHQEKDSWDKAAVISSFLSTVVIAAVGLAVTVSIQKAQLKSSEVVASAQIALAKENAIRDAKLQDSKLTTDLLAHLMSDDPAHRRIALIALRETVESNVADSIISVLAEHDDDFEVRSAAIYALNPLLGYAVAPILQRSFTGGLAFTPADTYLIDTNTFLALALDDASASSNKTSGLISSMLEVLDGKADSNHNGETEVDELARYLQVNLAEGPKRASAIHIKNTLPGDESVFPSNRVVSFVLDSPDPAEFHNYELGRRLSNKTNRLNFYNGGGDLHDKPSHNIRFKFADIMPELYQAVDSNTTVMIYLTAGRSLSSEKASFDENHVVFGPTPSNSVSLNEIRMAVSRLGPRRTFWFVDVSYAKP